VENDRELARRTIRQGIVLFLWILRLRPGRYYCAGSRLASRLRAPRSAISNSDALGPPDNRADGRIRVTTPRLISPAVDKDEVSMSFTPAATGPSPAEIVTSHDDVSGQIRAGRLRCGAGYARRRTVQSTCGRGSVPASISRRFSSPSAGGDRQPRSPWPSVKYLTEFE
jgi:hypothetical protein